MVNPGYFGVLTIVLMIGVIVTRVFWLKKQGVNAMQFGKLDKTDFLIPPFMLFYFYTLFAAAFDLPTVSRQALFDSAPAAWLGVLFCLVGLLALLWSLVSFGQSFRIGIDIEQPDKLVTNGIYAVSRNPIYTAFGVILLGEFLIFPGWIPMIYLGAAVWLFHRQVLREEAFMVEHYGKEYQVYCAKVRRYF